jgi:hypothetical protein
MTRSWYTDLWIVGAIIILILAAQAVALHFFGHPLTCTCGYVKFWEGNVLSSGNSQHIADWYTFSHIIHGFVFYFILRLLFPRMPVITRLVLAVGIEAAWEITENTPWLIDRYRQQALAQGYTGDSIINSISDTVAMIGGFLLTRRIRVWLIVVLALTLELFSAFFIRDNLSLNIINLLYSSDAIHAWQSAHGQMVQLQDFF